jgi:flagellar basal body-associated protein FliL
MDSDVIKNLDAGALDLPSDSDSPIGQDQAEEGPPLRTAFQSSGRKLKMAVLLLFTMCTQMLLGFMLLPIPAQSSMASTDGSAEDSAESPFEVVEVPVGKFNPTLSYGVGIVHVSFTLTAIVATDNRLPVLDALRDTHAARIRSAVDEAIRSSTLEDLADPKLYVVKRKIREEINHVLQKKYVIKVVLDQVRVMYQ